MEKIGLNMQPPSTLAKLHQSPQTISFTGHDDTNSVEITSEDVTIIPSCGEHQPSSKITLKNIVDFNWELRFYAGQLLAVHIGGKYVAYGIKTVGKNTGFVRVVNRENNGRTLLKGMTGMVQDIAFAHIPSQVVLACVDEYGNLLVHQVEEKGDKISCTLLLHVEHGNDSVPATNHRVVWCPYVPEEDSDSSEISYDDVAKLLVLTHDSKAELWNVGTVTNRYGVGPLRPDDVEEGYLAVQEHTDAIVDAAFSPDGTALATASKDGDVKFFQVYMHNGGKPRCLHFWQPHDGKPLSSLFFLDNHKVHNPDTQFWKFAITGAENNSELKVWSCESWTCLQTVKFKPKDQNKGIVLKAGLDLGAGHLLLSDIYNKVLYIFQISKDKLDSVAYISSASEMFLQSPILSFGIVDAGLRHVKSVSSSSLDEICNEDLDDQLPTTPAVVVKMFIVQPKSLHECHIVLPAPASVAVDDQASTVSKDSHVFQDNFSDVSLNMITMNGTDMDSQLINITKDEITDSKHSTSPANHQHTQQEQQLQHKQVEEKHDVDDDDDEEEEEEEERGQQQVQQPPQQLNLMTPDAFSSPAKKESPTEILNPLVVSRHNDSSHMPRILDVPISGTPVIKNMDISLDCTVNGGLALASDSPKREGFASGGSSPSREVQEILSLKSPECLNHSFYEEKAESDDCLNILNPVVNIDTKALPAPKDKLQFDVLQKDSLKVNITEGDGWPEIPMMLAAEMRKSVASEESNSKRNSAGMQPEKLMGNLEIDLKNQQLLKTNQRLEASVTALSEQINTLTSVLHEQQLQIKELKNEIQIVRQEAMPERFASQLEPYMTAVISSQIEKILKSHDDKIAPLLEEMLTTRDEHDRKRQDALMSAISQTVGNLVSAKLEDIVCIEIKDNILPAILEAIDPIKNQLHTEMAQKLSATDHLLKENISKLVQSKSVMEVLSSTLVGALQPVVKNTYKEMFGSTALPAFEKACQNMFQQLNEVFTKGLKEHVQTFESHFDKQRRQQEKGRDVLSQIQAVAEILRSSTENIPAVIQQEVQSQIQKELVSLQDNLTKAVGIAVKDNITKEFHAQQSVIEDRVLNAVRSRAVTPAPHILDSQLQKAQLMQLIAQGQINPAFQQALSASDLSLVVFVCERVNPQQIFSQTPCPLQQHVLLSLIQQLSADMENDTEIKHKYLEEAVMNLETNNALTREHLPTVISALQRQLSAYITKNPNNKITRSMKMLLMATRSLLKQ